MNYKLKDVLMLTPHLTGLNLRFPIDSELWLQHGARRSGRVNANASPDVPKPLDRQRMRTNSARALRRHDSLRLGYVNCAFQSFGCFLKKG
jgi:hypothetical protein